MAEVEQQLSQMAIADQDDDPEVHPYSASYSRSTINSVLGREDGGVAISGKTLVVGGWVKSGREQGGGAFSFIQLNDGSIFTDLQVYMPKELGDKHGGKDLLKTGACLLVRGKLTETPGRAEQAVELRATEVLHFGPCDSKAYPMAKKKHGMEFLREKAHLRPRTNVIGAVARVRNQLSFATHQFFQSHGFLYVHTPIITASDCEGAGETFQVTTLLDKLAENTPAEAPAALQAEFQEKEAAEATQAAAIATLKEEMKTAESSEAKSALNGRVQAEVKLLKAAKEETEHMRTKLSYVGGIKRLEDGVSVDYKEDFFAKPAFLTVSGQLNGEYYACALSNVYTFGPTFRAEDSHTSRHLAEFWMIEPEMAFCTLQDDMQCAEDYVRHCCRHILSACLPDLTFLNDRIDDKVMERLRHVADTAFKRISYTEAIELLQEAIKGGRKFDDTDIHWGMDMASEHERYICEEVFKQPTVVYNYPKEIKAFYMKLNEDDKTVAAMDVLVPGIGELIGGSQREDNLESLEARIAASGMPLEPYEGYLDLRKYGNVPHSGFGLGFERLVMFATGLGNIRDVIPFPRYPGNAAY